MAYIHTRLWVEEVARHSGSGETVSYLIPPPMKEAQAVYVRDVVRRHLEESEDFMGIDYPRVRH